jgi:hypothetical protein
VKMQSSRERRLVWNDISAITHVADNEATGKRQQLPSTTWWISIMIKIDVFR